MKAIDRLNPQRVVHMLNQTRKHSIHLRSLALEIDLNIVAALGCNQINNNLSLLAESPEAPLHLIKLLVRVRRENNRVCAVLPVQAPSSNFRLSHDAANLAAREGGERFFLFVVRV